MDEVIELLIRLQYWITRCSGAALGQCTYEPDTWVAIHIHMSHPLGTQVPDYTYEMVLDVGSNVLVFRHVNVICVRRESEAIIPRPAPMVGKLTAH